jgi:hypothetical protein
MEGVRLALKELNKLKMPLKKKFLLGLHKCLTNGTKPLEADEIRNEEIHVGYIVKKK